MRNIANYFFSQVVEGKLAILDSIYSLNMINMIIKLDSYRVFTLISFGNYINNGSENQGEEMKNITRDLKEQYKQMFHDDEDAKLVGWLIGCTIVAILSNIIGIF